MSTTNATRRSRRLTSPSARRAAPVAVPSLTTSLYATGFRSPPASWVGSARHDRARPRRRLRGRRVLITGGLGFIGSNLARELVEAGREVAARRLADRRVRRQPRSTSPGSRTRVRVNISDVRDEHSLRYLVRDQDYLFNLAGPDEPPRLDARPVHATSRSTAAASSRSSRRAGITTPTIRIVFASTRQIYGRPQHLPVDEEHPIQPGRRERHQQDRRRVVPPALRRRVRTSASPSCG